MTSQSVNRDIQTADTLAAAYPDVLARLPDLKVYLRYLHLMWMRGVPAKNSVLLVNKGLMKSCQTLLIVLS